MVKFKIRNDEDRRQLNRLHSEGVIGIMFTYTVPNDYPKYYALVDRGYAFYLQGIKKHRYDTLPAVYEECTFQQFVDILKKRRSYG